MSISHLAMCVMATALLLGRELSAQQPRETEPPTHETSDEPGRPDADAKPPATSTGEAKPGQPSGPGLPFLLSVNLTAGATFGGGNLADTNGPSTGEGFYGTLGALVMPLWFGELGMGFGVDFGYRYAGKISLHGSLEMRRFPLVAYSQWIFDFGHGWFGLAAGGLHTEFGIKWYQGGDTSPGLEQKMPVAVGGMAGGGVGYTQGGWMLDASVRQTWISYEARPAVDASNLGLLFRLHRTF